ncbi:MAG: cation:proton antiporter [Candidatus Cloacimonetes bacterium]|nr:cation:proton antiporter [Candidatus Cloacimonadota bacterium]
MEHKIFLDLAIIIFLSKVLGAISRKFRQPPVIGMLLLGVVLGPTVLSLIKPDEIILWIGKVGVLFLLFEAGLETDIKQIKRDSKEALAPAIGGIILPYALGFGFSYLLNPNIFQALIVGIIFTATSVSVSVMTLLDLGKLKKMEGRCIVNAAIIDDIVGILLLTIIFGITSNIEESNANLFIQLGKIVLFFVLTIGGGYFLLKPFFFNLKKLLLDNVVISLAVAVVMLYAWLAEATGLAAITGAYFAGLFVGQTEYKHKIKEDISLLGKSFFVDVFFVGIGLEFNLFDVKTEPLVLLGFTILAILGKIVGSGIGSKINGFDTVRSLRIGFGMVPRGEVALIVANMALARNLITADILSATIIMVILSAIFTPIMLKFSFIKLGRKGFKLQEEQQNK